MRRPLVRDLSGGGRLIRQPPQIPSRLEEAVAVCVACGNDNSALYPGPDGSESLCATCTKRLGSRKLRLWRKRNGTITAKPSSDSERVIAVGFELDGTARRNFQRPRVRKATASEHAQLPAHRPGTLPRGKRPNRERSEETGWEPNSSEADPEHLEDEDDDDEGDEDETNDDEEDADNDEEDELEEEDDEDDDEEGDEELAEEQVRVEVIQDMRQLELRGRKIPIRCRFRETAISLPRRRYSSRISSRNTAEASGQGSDDANNFPDVPEPSAPQQPAKRRRTSPDDSEKRSPLDEESSRNESPQPFKTPSHQRELTQPFAKASRAPNLLKMGPSVDAIGTRGLSFGVKASCSYGWMTQRRYVYVAYGLRFESFKQVLGETFNMDSVPFAVCYVDDEGDEIIISEDSDMRPMFEMAKGKEGALRVRLRPP